MQAHYCRYGIRGLQNLGYLSKITWRVRDGEGISIHITGFHSSAFSLLPSSLRQLGQEIVPFHPIKKNNEG